MKNLQTTSNDLVGAAAAVNVLTDFQYAECGQPNSSYAGAITRAQTDVLKLNLIRQLVRRKVYLWMWADLNGTSAATAWQVQASLKFYVQNSMVCSLPVCLGNSNPAQEPAITPYNTCLVNVCTGGGNPVEDSIGLYIWLPNSSISGITPNYVVLQPQYLTGEIDEVRLSWDLVHPNVVNLRAWLGVMSSQY